MRHPFLMGIIVSLTYLFFIPVVSASFAAILEFDPATKTAAVGETINVSVKINTGTDEVRASDGFIQYDSAYLEPQSNITTGGFFSTIFNNIDTTKVYVAGMEETGGVKKGTGTIAVVPFKTKKNGTATLTFICGTNTANDSTIIKAQGSTNIIDCNGNGKSTITIGTGGGTTTPTATPTPVGGGGTAPTATPLPTYAPTATPTPIPAQLPQSGIPANIGTYASVGAVLLLLGIGVRMIL